MAAGLAIMQDMSRDYPRHPIPAVLAAIARDGKLALVQRDKEAPPRRWGLPGGAIEPGETPAQAVIRELAEETGLQARAGDIIATFDMINHDADGRVRTHFLILVVECHWLSGEGHAASDAALFGWFDRAEIAALKHVHDRLPLFADRLLGPLP